MLGWAFYTWEFCLLVGVFMLTLVVAELEKMDKLLWGLVAFVVCVGCTFLPWPYLRVLIAGGVIVAAMMLRKLLRGGLG